MSAEKPLTSQLVELLGISETTGLPPSNEPVVIITVRSQPNSFRPHNIALKKAQAIRLLKDLESLLKVPAVLLILAVLACGCSARIEVERTNDTSATATEISSSEIGRTAVEVDFQPRSQQPVSQREPTQPPPVPVPPEPQPVIVKGNTVIFSYREGVTHNETHIHVHDAPQRHLEETVVIRREVQAESRPIDPRCEQLRREHEERVRTWKAFPLRE